MKPDPNQYGSKALTAATRAAQREREAAIRAARAQKEREAATLAARAQTPAQRFRTDMGMARTAASAGAGKYGVGAKPSGPRGPSRAMKDLKVPTTTATGGPHGVAKRLNAYRQQFKK